MVIVRLSNSLDTVSLLESRCIGGSSQSRVTSNTGFRVWIYVSPLRTNTSKQMTLSMHDGIG